MYLGPHGAPHRRAPTLSPHAPEVIIDADVIVIGAGPAGLSIASALVAHDLRTRIIAPQWPSPWPNQYGVWLDELAHDETIAACASHAWSAPTVRVSDNGPLIPLDRTYARLDNGALQDVLTDRFISGGGIVERGEVCAVSHEKDSSIIELGDSRRVSTRLVIDATGHAPLFVQREAARARAWQIAWGVRARLAPESAPIESMRLMDWSACDTPWRAAHIPTFLYAMPLEPGVIFVEETSLASRPALPMEEARRRLDARLEREGIILDEILEMERCVIPMGHALPDRTQRVVGWGGAASMVHPATGYQIARALSWAPQTARAIASLLDRGARGEALSHAVWESVWTPDRVAARQLYQYGLEAMLAFETQDICAFFESFFDLPRELWGGYLSGSLGRYELAQVMWRVFGASTMATRWELVRPALSGHAPLLMRGLWKGRAR